MALASVKIGASAIHHLGSQIATKQEGKGLDERTFIAFYGTTPEIIAESWSSVSERVMGSKPKHILWACMFLKLYLPEDVMCILAGTSKPTFRKWVWPVIESLALMSVDVVSFS